MTKKLEDEVSNRDNFRMIPLLMVQKSGEAIDMENIRDTFFIVLFSENRRRWCRILLFDQLQLFLNKSGIASSFCHDAGGVIYPFNASKGCLFSVGMIMVWCQHFDKVFMVHVFPF